MIEDLRLSRVTSSFVGPFGEIGRQSELVAQAWDLDDVEAAYELFLEAFSSAAPSTPADVMRHQIHLVHTWRRFPFLDPRLPPELLPPGWTGASAAVLFGTLHARWDGPAQQHWAELVA